MNRTLEDMYRDLNSAEERLKPLDEARNNIKQGIRNLEEEIEKYKLDNALYHPMSELINYIGKDISSITLVERNEDGTLDTDYLYRDEIFEVNKYGQLYYSSYSGGIIEYDSDAHKYVHMYYYHPTYHDYIGFMEIEFEDE